MKKELMGLVWVFVILFVFVALISYSPEDPSINHAIAADQIHNRFGLFGAHFSGLVIGLFGIGSFWMPVLILICGFRYFDQPLGEKFKTTLIGCSLLIIATGAVLSIRQHEYFLFGDNFSSGGIIGISLMTICVKLFNPMGSAILLLIFAVIGFRLMTGLTMDKLILYGQKAYFSGLYWYGRIQLLHDEWRGIEHATARPVPVPASAPASHRSKPNPVKPTTIPQPPELRLNITSSKSLVKKLPEPNYCTESGFELPHASFLDDGDETFVEAEPARLKHQCEILQTKLESFGVKGRVVAVAPGPVITTFEYEPDPGVKINKIVNLSDDLALGLSALSIRIVAPIPGRSVVGIEIPNHTRQIVRLKDVIFTDTFQKSKSKLSICLGKDIVGNSVVANLDKMPHLLIAGATGAGKSVGLNAMICSMLYKSGPEDVKFIMIDPKRIELSVYDGIPHLIAPVVTDVQMATQALFWAIEEMERRYRLLSEKQVRNIARYNQKIEKGDKQRDKTDAEEEKLPYIVIIIDELAELMMVSSKDVEVALTRLAQMSRAAGIHLILATQRPSVDILTGVIKANFPTRISYKVSSKIDSRTIIDSSGAETLLGNGDMLFLPPGSASLQRIHGTYISEDELNRITDFLKKRPEITHHAEIIQFPERHPQVAAKKYDEKYDDAVAIVTDARQASVALIKRRLKIGEKRAIQLIEAMEEDGIIGPSDGLRPRLVLIRSNVSSN